jgi:hypothetical protein
MGQAKKLHTDWQNFKNERGATMIKDANLKLNAGLGPKLETLDAKWGTKDGQKAADEVKKIVPKYQQMISSAKPSAKSKKGPDGNTRDSSNVSTNPYQDQKKAADALLKSILAVANQHKPSPQ